MAERIYDIVWGLDIICLDVRVLQVLRNQITVVFLLQIPEISVESLGES